MNKKPEPPRRWTWPHYRFAQYSFPLLCKLLGGWRVCGLENVPEQGGALIASNHLSFADPVIVGSALRRRTYYFAKAELFVPIFGWIIRKCYAFPVERGGADMGAAKEAIKLLEAGELLTLFPEGTRGRDGKLQELSTGAVMLASRGGVPIIPCAICGSDDILPIGAKFFHRGKVAVSFGAPIDSLQYGERPAKQELGVLTEQLRDSLVELQADQQQLRAVQPGQE